MAKLLSDVSAKQNKSLLWDIRDTLDQLNMNERMIYPGKDGIAKWLARHYFVRDES